MNSRRVIISHIFPGPLRIHNLTFKETFIGNNSTANFFNSGISYRPNPFGEEIFFAQFFRSQCRVAPSHYIQITIQHTVFSHVSVYHQFCFEPIFRPKQLKHSAGGDKFHGRSRRSKAFRAKLIKSFTGTQVFNQQTYICIFQQWVCCKIFYRISGKE